MFIELDYFYISSFDLEVKVTEILKYILFFSEEKHSHGKGINYQVI